MMRCHLAGHVGAVAARMAQQLDRFGARKMREVNWRLGSDREREVASNPAGLGGGGIALYPEASGDFAGIDRAVVRELAVFLVKRNGEAQVAELVERAGQDELIVDRYSVVGEEPRAGFGHRGQVGQLDAAKSLVTAETGTRRAARVWLARSSM